MVVVLLVFVGVGVVVLCCWLCCRVYDVCNVDVWCVKLLECGV